MMPLAQHEIVRELRRYVFDKRDADKTGRGRVPIKALADYIGLHRVSLWKYIDEQHIPARQIEPLSRAITAIRDGKLKFVRHGNQWHVEGDATGVM